MSSTAESCNSPVVLKQNPYAVEDTTDGLKKLINFHYGTHIDLTSPRSEAWTKAGVTGVTWPTSDESIDVLYQLGFLIPESELCFRAKGLDRPAPYPLGIPKRMLCHTPQIGEYVVLGIPSDRGNKSAGARDGPRIIRRGFSSLMAAIQESIDLQRPMIDFSMGRSYDTSNLRLTDFGDIIDDTFASAADLFRRINFAVQKIVAAGATPIILGGDHSITASTLIGMAEISGPPVLLQFDAHHDCYIDTFSQRTGLTHGNFVQHLIDHRVVSGIVQMGLRTVESVPSHFPHLNGAVQYISDYDFLRSNDHEILSLLPAKSSYYVSIDLDVLPPEQGGYTATPVFGGINPARLIRFLDVLFRNRTIAGIDIVEARSDPVHNSEKMMDAASRIILACILSTTPFRYISALNQTKQQYEH